MISAFANSFKIPELRNRIIFTIAMLVIVRMGSYITLPGVNSIAVQDWVRYLQEQGGGIGGGAAFAQLLNAFSGGGIARCAVFALGIMPYISASIMMQLLSAVVPRMSKLAREEGGRMKINQYTRLATLLLCVGQGIMMWKGLVNPSGNYLLPQLDNFLNESGSVLLMNKSWVTGALAVLSMTAGCFFLIWLGDQITEKGIGNGTSLIIACNILADLPGALVQVWKTYMSTAAQDPMKVFVLLLLVLLLIFVIAGVIAITQAARRVVIQYAKRQIGRKVVGGQNTHLPLKVNYAGVMPIIFAQAIILFPSQILTSIFANQTWGQKLQEVLSGDSIWYYIVEALLIFFFSYFWVATMFQPTQIADDLKKNGGYIPGIRPGEPTAQFLEFTMGRLTAAGAVFLVVLAMAPILISKWMGVSPIVAQFFGGTSILIAVGVVLDVMKQVETHLLKQQYDGFLKNDKTRSKYAKADAGSGLGGANLTWLFFILALVIIAVVTYLVAGGNR